MGGGREWSGGGGSTKVPKFHFLHFFGGDGGGGDLQNPEEFKTS